MKKILSILAVALTLASCAHFDDSDAVKYGAGPAVDVQVSNVTDNAFTVTVIPADGTTYYTYLVDESTEVEELDPYTLLKRQYSGSVVLNTEDNQSYTFVQSAKPYTDYVVYAVASNDKGITGDVVAVQVKTSDGEAPAYRQSEAAEDGSATITFSEAVTRGEGAVTAFYLAEWSGEIVDVPADDITVDVNGTDVTVSIANLPAGAYVFISWAEGAFLDVKGNKCAKYESKIDFNSGELIGVYTHVAQVPFDIEDEYVEPAGEKIKNWEEEQITVTFPFSIYRNDEELTGEEILITYVGEDKTTVYKVAADAWTVEDSTIVINLPAEPAQGDVIGLYIEESTVYDDFGNPNNEYELEEGWLYDNSAWAAAFIGTFRYTTFFGDPDDPYDDEGLVLYQSLEEEGVYKIEGVFYGVDFIFTMDDDGKITWDPQFSGYHYDSYDKDVYVIDRWWWTDGDVEQGYYSQGVFYFPTYYYMQDLGGWYDGYETFTLTGKAGAKARKAGSQKNLKANKSVEFTKDTLVKSLNK